MRAVVADALGVFAHESTLDELIELTAHGSADVRASAARAIRRTGSRRGVAALIPLLTDRDTIVRMDAREALAALGGEQAIAALRDNPTRSWPLRRRDAFRARASTRFAARFERRGGAPVAHRLTTRSAGVTVRAALLAVALTALALGLLGASPLVLGAAAVPGAIAGSLRRHRENTMTDVLDEALARLQECPAGLTVASRATTLARGLRARPIYDATWLLLPLALDAAMGGIGVVPGLGAGFLARLGLNWSRDARRVRRFERPRGMRLYTWGTPIRRCYCDLAAR